jgi:hypothetical protein
MADAPDVSRKRKLPPAGYQCKACGESGHWIHECKDFKPTEKAKKKAKPATDDAKPVAVPVSAARDNDMVHCSCGKRCRKRCV